MNKQETIYFLNQAIHKTQEAYEALELLESNGLALDIDAYTGANDLVIQVLNFLYKREKEFKEAEIKAKAKELWKKRLCKKLGITLPRDDLW